MTSINRELNGNIVLTLKLEWDAISSEFTKVLDDAISNTELPGFRKGKAPKDLVEPKLDKSKLYSKAIESLLPVAYSASIKEHNLKPILTPQVQLVTGEENKDWEFTATTCELPAATLPDLTAIPKGGKLEDAVSWLQENSKIQVPDMLVDQEVNHRLSALVENVTKLGMSIDSYLQSKKMTVEDLRAQSAVEARVDLSTEFVLEELRKFKSFKTRKETLDFLLSLV